MFCQATCPNCQAANSESPHPVFQVAGHACVERSLGFVGHDVERGLFHDGCTVMDSRLRGNDGGGLRRRESMAAVLVLRDNTASFPHRRKSMIAVLVLHDNTESFPRRRESMVAVLVLHDNTESFPRRRESMIAVLVLRDNTASFPRRRESIGRYSDSYRSFHSGFFS